MDPAVIARMGLVYAHLLVCAFALRLVLVTDWRVLRGTIAAGELPQVHRQMIWLLAGLWATGATIVAVDLGGHFSDLAARPKLLTKLLCVTVLTLNGWLLGRWCFPRLAGGRLLGDAESLAVLACGALSTAHWLLAAFLGIARPLQSRTLAECLGLYLAVMVATALMALLLQPLLRRAPGSVFAGAPRRLKPGMQAEADAALVASGKVA